MVEVATPPHTVQVMAEETPSEKPSNTPHPRPDDLGLDQTSKNPSLGLPPEAEKALEKILEEGGPKALISFFAAFSRTTSIGPDPETAKILAQVEIHGEDSRLKGYEATLRNRDAQNGRDDGFRRKRLNHETLIQIIVLVVAIAGLGTGLYLYVSDRKELGGYVLFASFFLMYNAAGGRLSLPRPPQT